MESSGSHGSSVTKINSQPIFPPVSSACQSNIFYVDLVGEAGHVLAGVTLSKREELSVSVLWEQCEELLEHLVKVLHRAVPAQPQPAFKQINQSKDPILTPITATDDV